MSLGSLFNFGRRNALPPVDAHTRQVEPERPLRRVLAFTGHTIDDVINDPIARRKVAGYFKMHLWVARESERSDLERQWNSPAKL